MNYPLAPEAMAWASGVDIGEKTLPRFNVCSKLIICAVMDRYDSISYKLASKIIQSKWFNSGIIGLIVLNGIFIGVQTSPNIPKGIQVIQLLILFVFFFEIILRWFGRESTKVYWRDGWNWFDLLIVGIGVIPEIAELAHTDPNGESKNSVLSTLRILRVLQLTRSFRAIRELQFLLTVLIRSIHSLSYITLLFVLVMYMYAIVGVTLFKNKSYDKSENLYITGSNPDPYQDLGEAFFTLFRVITGEDWTDLRYNLLDNEYTKVHGAQNDFVGGNIAVTLFHISWIIVASYLLINLIVGTVINNFQLVLYEKQKRKMLDQRAVAKAKREVARKKALKEEEKEEIAS